MIVAMGIRYLAGGSYLDIHEKLLIVDFGLNLQASCNHRSQFNFVSIAAPGKTGDARAIRKTSFLEKLARVPATYYVVADAAYSLSEKVLVPFTGSNRNDPIKDAFNYFLSPQRIRIEMAFGHLTGKWRILSTPLECSLSKSSNIIMACCRLHNFVIESDIPLAKSYPRLSQC